MYLILSLKHTKKEDESITLWRSNNQGYCSYLESAGQYENFIEDYHNSEGNIPINQTILNKLDKIQSLNDYGEPVTFIHNSKKNHSILKVEFVKRKLCKK
ncbi:hypothetical protein [Empedobacter sp. GD03797]|uniref:hypothetical protein n=1 Tax=Empedobacter sp. GD03797 TaxID=2975382 RepID=UPI00244C65FD|nr:hypothetical protein [Empedobacter sp. GD03797]MDH1883943.1 hypothetical protein [Empedobacter sp. GD03797]